MLYAKLIVRIALITCENMAHIEFYLQGLLRKILAIYTITHISFGGRDDAVVKSACLPMKPGFDSFQVLCSCPNAE